jgi:hypothetical protein
MNESLKQGLRDLLAFIKANDDFNFEACKHPNLVELDFPTWWLEKCDAATQKSVLTDLVKRLGHAKKDYTEGFVNIDRRFGDHVRLHISAERQTVCERIVVGQRIVPAHDEYTVPAEPEKTVDIVEWKCAPILAEELTSSGA